MRLIFTNIIMQHTSHFKWLHHIISIPLQRRDHHTVTMETTGPCYETSTQCWLEVCNSTITSKLPFSICNVPWMEVFIWSCSTEANHCIKTRTSWRATCRSYLSLQLPDAFPKTYMSKTVNHISPKGWSHHVSSFLIGPRAWLLWQQSKSLLLKVVLRNHNTLVHLTVSSYFLTLR